MMKHSGIISLILILALSISACSAATQAAPTQVNLAPTSAQLPQATGQPTGGYPAPESSGASQAYPEPQVTQETTTNIVDSLEIPQPGGSTGVVTGRLVEASSNEPFLAPLLLLGAMVYGSDPSAPPLVGYSEETDPSAKQDRAGKFVFTDVKPGSYAIVIWTPNAQALVSDRAGKTVEVIVEAGKLIDLGDVFVP